MFAVIRTGGKQYKVAKDDVITVEKILGEPGEKVQLGDVLMLGEEGKAPTVGTPLVEKAAVTAEFSVIMDISSSGSSSDHLLVRPLRIGCLDCAPAALDGGIGSPFAKVSHTSSSSG